MFGLGIWEIVVIAVIALLVLGPRRLPEAARQLGRVMRDLRRATNDLKRGLESEQLDPMGLVQDKRLSRRDVERPEPPPDAPAVEDEPSGAERGESAPRENEPPSHE